MPIIKIVNVSTGVEIEREMTEVELQEYTDLQKQRAEETKAENDKAEAKAILLSKLGITDEEAKLLLS